MQYVNEMTWAEFQIRAYGYKRMQEKEDLRAREIAWNSLIGNHVNPKKLPKTKDKFWSIGIKNHNVTDVMRNRIEEVKAAYFKKLNGNR